MSEAEKQIQQLEAQKEEVKGTPCEVFTRVSGFYRPQSNFNKGKKEEFADRKTATLGSCSDGCCSCGH